MPKDTVKEELKLQAALASALQPLLQKVDYESFFKEVFCLKRVEPTNEDLFTEALSGKSYER